MKKVWFVDYWCEDTTKGNFILDMLPDGYVVSNENPDIVFSFCNDNAFKSYNNAIKIQVISQEAFYFENLHEFDYVVGFNDDERHIYIPYWTATWSDYLKSGCSASNQRVVVPFKEKKFCSHLGITTNRIYRKHFIDILNRYKRVDHLERESLRANKELRDKYKSKLDFIAQYKFNITFENTNKDGYITEKAIDPFLAHTIPVYYGNYKTAERDFDMSKMLFFNPSDVGSLVRKIQELDNNEDMYNSFISGTLDHIGSRYNAYVEKFRSFIMNVHKVI